MFECDIEGIKKHMDDIGFLYLDSQNNIDITLSEYLHKEGISKKFNIPIQKIATCYGGNNTMLYFTRKTA